MTIEQAKERLVSWLKSQLGYCESGDNNTKYADESYDTRLYGFDMHGQPWCDYFVDYAFIFCFGFDTACKMTYQYPNGSAACKISANYYKQHGAFYTEPEIGDQVFFYYDNDINHTGVVIDIYDGIIETIEGNSSDRVKKNMYSCCNPIIAGYGRPNWSLVSDECSCDDISEDIEEEPLFVLKNGTGINDPQPKVAAWQAWLVQWGCYDRSMDIWEFIDGEFGNNTEKYTRMLQEKLGLPNDGVVDEDDWGRVYRIDIPE